MAPTPSPTTPAARTSRSPAPGAAAARLGVLAAALSALLLVLVAARWGPLMSLDAAVTDRLHQTAVTEPGRTRVIKILSDWVWDPWTMRLLLAALVCRLVLRGQRRLGVWVAATALAGTALQQAVKAAVDRARPVWPDPVDSAHYAAFPSGHAMSVLVAGALVCWLLRLRGARPLWRWAAATAAVVSSAGVGFTRVYLGVHWPSDVVGGWLLGGALVAASAWAYGTASRRRAARPPDDGSLPADRAPGQEDGTTAEDSTTTEDGPTTEDRTPGMTTTRPAFKGVLFDFSGTLLRIEPAESWLRASLAATGTSMSEDGVRRTAAALADAGALPGGSTPVRIPADLADLWAERDRDATRHRALYTGLARQVPLPAPELYEALYARHMLPDAWHPYPDAARVLTELHRRGVRLGVVSNIGWDLRPVLRAHGLDRHLDSCVLSYEHGIQKPDPRLFALACAELALDPAEVLMVGDDRTADGGATALGCGYLPVDHLPPADRPSGLTPVLDLVE